MGKKNLCKDATIQTKQESTKLNERLIQSSTQTTITEPDSVKWRILSPQCDWCNTAHGFILVLHCADF